MLESFFIYGDLPPNVETGVYQLPLVVLSYVVASFASYTALALAQQIVNSKSIGERRLFHWGGAFAMGAGIWSMHFIGMLSYKMRMVVIYDPALTLLSMLIAIAVAYGVLTIVARERLASWQVLISAVLLGFGICGMHYTGMAAMQMDADLRYIPSIFFLSVIIAIAASGAALWMAFTLARYSSGYRYLFQIGAALVMGAAICGMHYTGMAASVMIPYADCRYDPNQNFDVLALSIAGITSLILGLALAAGIYKKMRTELQLQHSESKLRAIIENALDAVIGMDQQGRITEWNKQAETIFGWSHQEAMGTKLSALIIPPEYREAHQHGLQRFLADGTNTILNKRIEMMALNKRGQTFPVELTVTAQKLQREYQFTAFIRDITDRKRGEKMMELLAAIVQSSDDSIISRTLDGIITSWNTGAEQLFGYSAAEAVGQHISLIIPPERRMEEQQILSQLRAGKSVDHFETVRRHKDGRLIDVSLAVSLIYDASGQIAGVSKMARDITKRKQTEERLKSTLNEIITAKRMAEEALETARIEREKADIANRAKTEFLANMSHEIRTPLNTIIGTSELLAHTPLDNKQAEYTEVLNTAGDMLLGLINNILDLSKIEAGEFNLLTLPVAVRSLLEEIARIMSELAQANNVTLSISCPNDVPISVLGDPLRLKQILLNLTSNAVKFCRDGKVTLKVEKLLQAKNKVTLRFSIEDTGPGIPADKLDIIFEKFTQLDDFSTKKYAGTGLGLTICKRLVEMMGGKITVNSVVGQGSAFWFDITFALDNDAVIDEMSIQMLFKAKRVLVIDASHYNRHAISECLESLGITCDTAISVPVGLTRLIHHPQAYHLLFIDQSLPEMSEQEIDRTLCAFRKVVTLPVVLMTSLKSSEIPAFIQKAGFAKYLIKPVSSSALLNVLTSVLQAENQAGPLSSRESMPPDKELDAYKFRGKVLLVEDYLPNQKMAKYMLEEMGCDVGLAASGEEALEQLQANHYDVVLMDCQMPEMDGFQATAEIRKHDYGRDIVIVAMTANALQGDREKCLDAGMNDYIGKPVRFEDLGQLLSKYLAA